MVISIQGGQDFDSNSKIDQNEITFKSRILTVFFFPPPAPTCTHPAYILRGKKKQHSEFTSSLQLHCKALLLWP